MTLDDLAIKYGTDKSSKGHSYCQYYDMILTPIRKQPVKLLEIGIDKGASLLMWRDYFENGEIHGIDIRDGYEYLNGVTTHVVDQSSFADLFFFGEQYPYYFDIVVDDGSHMSSDMIKTFSLLFQYLKPSGYYIIEDLLCDYDDRWNKGESVIEYIKNMIGEVNMNGIIPNSHICANKKEAIAKYKANYFETNIEWVFAACGTVIIKKI